MEGSSNGSIAGPRYGIIGAAIVAHAPQLLSMPPSEDKDQIARSKAAMKAIGDELRKLEPDLVIVISNCHGEDLVVHCVPPFMIHCGDIVQGAEKHKGEWRVDSAAGNALVRQMLDQGFDPAFTLDMDVATPFTIAYDFCGFDRSKPFLPIFVNAYVPPQPKPERCFAFGKALARSLELMQRRAVIIISDGLSHYPITPMYPTPDVATDKVIFERIASGNLMHLMSYDETRLDQTGNIECRSLQVLAGAIGDRKPDSAVLEPSWHHVYAFIGWTSPFVPQNYVPWYPAASSQHVQIVRAVYALGQDKEALQSFLQDRKSFGAKFGLPPDEIEALAQLDEDVLRERYSVNPMLTFQAKLRTKDKIKTFR